MALRTECKANFFMAEFINVVSIYNAISLRDYATLFSQMITLALSAQLYCIYRLQRLYPSIEWITMRLDCARSRLSSVFSSFSDRAKRCACSHRENWSSLERGLNEREGRCNHNSIHRRTHKFPVRMRRRKRETHALSRVLWLWISLIVWRIVWTKRLIFACTPHIIHVLI